MAEASNITNLQDRAILGLQHNPKIWISEGRSRFDTNWKNKEMYWSELLARLKKPTVTQETQAEYMKMTKAQQDGIKDVGGFVGGTLSSGRRKSDTVQIRTLISFDLDTAPQNFPEIMELTADYGYAIYSTHKHKPEAPRVRLLIPLSRQVTPEEYEAIGRKLAEDIGLEYFDSTTFQPSRLMYWPSCSRDAEYIFDYSDAPPVNADEVLARYPDWHDISYWPVCQDELRVEKKRKEKQQDPATKKGLVGTFCRTYTVPEAIAEFIPDVYIPTEGKDDRYTFAAGSTSGGLVIYDNGLFCYSNHSTDPAHGMDLNAFDLIRIHKFGAEDENAPEGTQTSRLPSYKAMLELIRTDKNCLRTFDAERKGSALEDFAGEDGEAHEWRLELTRTKQGLVEPTMENLVMILRMDEKLQGLRYNRFTGFIDITQKLPWGWKRKEWADDDDAELYVYLSGEYNAFRRMDIADALVSVSQQRSYHPIESYLKSLPEWDGVPRMETLFIDYLGAEDNEYVREVTKRWLLAAVSRIFRPGCKFDYIPVLSGPGGIGKSTLVNKLGGDWFSDSLSFEDMKDKTGAEKIQRTWINEISELKGMRKMEVESVKSFLSRTEDLYRPAYGRRTVQRRRSCVFIGTTNAEDYLKDMTGNRRFWPVDCAERGKTKDSWDLTADEVAQIWAEVMFYYDTLDEKDLRLNKELEGVAVQMQLKALETDERIGMVEEYLNILLPENWEGMSLEARRIYLSDVHRDGGTQLREEVSVMEIWAECFGNNPMNKKRSDSEDIARMLLQLHWKHTKKAKRLANYGVQKMYKRGVTGG